jgi:polar amino acid transport system substrate-binding protein
LIIIKNKKATNNVQNALKRVLYLTDGHMQKTDKLTMTRNLKYNVIGALSDIEYIYMAGMRHQPKARELKTIITLLFGLIFAGCQNYPKDPMHTFDKVKEHTLKVAYSENGQWVREDNGIVSGIEAEIIKEFASSINAGIEWIKGPESELMPLLKEGECHIYIGGLVQTSPWRKHTAFSRPYTTAEVYIGVSPSMSPPHDIKNKKIGVRKGSSIGKYVKKKEGIPQYTDSLAHHPYIAAYNWEIKELGFTKTNIKLYEEKHVIAVPQGENRFLMEVEKFLDSHAKVR